MGFGGASRLWGVEPTGLERERRVQVMSTILDDVRAGRAVKLPAFSPELSRPSDEFALQSIGLEPNAYSGTIGPYRYQFEGEEDLLHLIVTRADGASLAAEEGQAVASFVLEGLPPALIWLRPGQRSQHFYFGHDELLVHLRMPEPG